MSDRHIFWKTKPKHAEDEAFVAKLCERVHGVAELLKIDNVAVRMTEFNKTTQRTSWQIKLEIGVEPLAETSCISGSQEYEAHLLTNQSENYTGSFVVSVIAEGQQVKSEHRILMMQIYAHYYECIHEDYPNWDTFYKNSPEFH